MQVNLNVSRKELKVFGVPPALSEERMRDRLEISFCRPSRGGGEVENLEYDKDTGEGLITFLHPGGTMFSGETLDRNRSSVSRLTFTGLINS